MVYASVYVLMLFGVHFGAVRCTLLTFRCLKYFCVYTFNKKLYSVYTFNKECTPLISNYPPRCFRFLSNAPLMFPVCGVLLPTFFWMV